MLIDKSDKSPRLNKPMAIVEVESVTTQALPNGYLVPAGKSQCKVYEYQIPEIEALVRTDEEKSLIGLAKKELARRIERYTTEKCGGDAKKAAETCPHSLESVYCDQNQGSSVPHIKPLLSMKIIEKGLPPPTDEDRFRVAESMTELVTTVVAKVLQELSNKQQGGVKPRN